MKSKLVLSLLLVCVLILTGCTSSRKHQGTLTDRDIASALTDLDERVTSLDTSVLSTSKKVDSFSQQITTLENEMDSIESRIDQLTSAKVEKSEPPMPQKPLGDMIQAPAEMKTGYQKAKQLMENHKRSEAITMFTQLANDYPNTTLTDNCHYWIGVNYFLTNDYPQAVTTMDQLLINYPESNKREHARIILGKSYLKMGRNADALTQFEASLNEPPGDFRAFAQQKVNELK